MARKRWKILLLLVLLVCPHLAEGKVFNLGIITEKPVEKKVEGYGPLARYLASRLTAFGITDGKVVVASDLREMLQKIRKREVDVVLESPFSTVEMQQKAGMKPTLLVWKHGKREYRTVFIVRKDSPLSKLSDLKGKLVALQDPGSTTAFLIPSVELRKAGLALVPAHGKAPPSAVRYLLVAHGKNQAFSVTEKKADAAAFSSDDWEDLPATERAYLKVIHTSRPVLRYLASFHPALKPDLRNAIEEVLVGLDRDPEGRKLLEGATGIKKMEPLSPEDRQSLEFIRQQIKRK